MYPKNNASPERLAIGQVILISDGTVQTSGVSIVVRGQGGAEGAGGGTTAYGADGTVYYTPTQAETNYTSFVVIAYKASCFSASQTVITTASSTAGQVDVKSIAGTAQTANDNGLDINTLLTRIVGTLAAGTHNPASAAQIAVLSDWINGGRLDLILDIIAADTTTDIPALIATAQDDLDTITGADGVALASTQQSITFQPITITAADGTPNINLTGSGAADGLEFSRSGSGGLFDTNWAAAVEAEVADALTAYAPATEAKQDAQDLIITEARLAELDAANLPADIATLLTRIIGTLATGTHNPASAAQIAVLTDLIDGGRLDLLIDAIKAKTDSLTFTKANELDSNVQSINGVTITGDGSATPFDV